MKRLRGLFLPLIALALFSCTAGAEPGGCGHIRGLNAKGILCGFVSVPEDHDVPDGRKIKIAYAVIKSQAEAKRPDPVVMLTGGPGGGALDPGFIGFMQQSPIVKSRDMVLLDQRGIQYSSALPDIGKGVFDAMAANTDLDGERKLIASALDAIKKKAAQENIDLGSYNTFQNAKDVEVLMRALGYKKYNLLGISYGTRLARSFQDLFPERLNAVILESPNLMTDDFLIDRIKSFSSAADKVIRACAADKKCGNDFPNLENRFHDAVKSLDKRPLKVEYGDSAFWLNPQDAMFFLRRQLYRNNALEAFPALVAAIEKRESKLIADAVMSEKAEVTNGSFNSTMFLAVSAYESMDSRNTAERIDAQYASLPHFPAKLGFFTNLYLEGMNFHNKRLPVDERKFQKSKIPTVIFVNQYDPVTPPENGALFQRDLERSKLYILDEAGHSGGDLPCKMSVMVEFMDDPKKDPDGSCLKIFKK